MQEGLPTPAGGGVRGTGEPAQPHLVESRVVDPRTYAGGARRDPETPSHAWARGNGRDVKDIPYIAAVIDSFLVMNGLAVLAALLVLAAMLMYLQV
jgi:hypothetical protein